jgi:uncharacterized membrane protein
MILPALGAGLGWFWACSLLAAREHSVIDYDVWSSVPPLWGFLALPTATLALLLLFSLALAAGAGYVARFARPGGFQPVYWLLPALLIPLLDALRSAGMPVPSTFFEPLLLTFLAASATASIARSWPRLRGQTAADRVWTWPLAIWLLTSAAALWWYWQGARAYDDFLLGYHDFGHFARRVVNTWEGRGFLREAPNLPAFWDHFNPGLALLVPLWAIWPDAKLFVLLQAVCLASPAPIIFGLARVWGATAGAAAVWAGAYLAYPVVGQLNLNYSYGWHPVSVALPLMLLALWALAARRYVISLVAALIACSFKETVWVTTACLAAALGFQTWLARRPGAGTGLPGSRSALIAGRLPFGTWMAVAALSTATLLVIVKVAPFAEFQTARFSNLGRTGTEVLLSPILRPRAFWGQIFQLPSLLFLLALLTPLGFRTVFRGGVLLAAAAPPLLLLLAWQQPQSTSIAFQYVTMLMPTFFLAALAGAAELSTSVARAAPDKRASDTSGFLIAGTSALVGGLTASTFFGALPWSGATLTVMLAKSYQVGGQHTGENPRAVGTKGHADLHGVVAMVDYRTSAVLASGRVAAHLLNVRRLESVEQAIARWRDLSAEAGGGRSGVEVFDWVVLDFYEQFQQSEGNMQWVREEAERAGYRVVHSRDGIVVLKRPGPSESPAAENTRSVFSTWPECCSALESSSSPAACTLTCSAASNSGP